MVIRILHIVTSMNAGGIETMLMNLYRCADKKRIQFDFLVHRKTKGFYDDEIRRLGGAIHYAERMRPHNALRYKKKLVAFFLNHPEYKIIHSHINSYSCLPLSAAKKAGIPVRIAQSHQYHETYRTIPLFRIPLIKFCNFMLKNQVTHRFACSRLAGQWLFGDHENFDILNNSVDSARFIYNLKLAEKMKRELKIQNKFVVGHIGNFSKAKNYPFILEVFNSIQKQNKDAVLMLVGNNQSNPNVEHEVKERGINEKVIFAGVRSDIPELLQAMDVFLFPSLHEGLPVTVIEAQASGLKCFLSDSITEEVKITDLVEFLSFENTAQEWAEQILQYANGYERKDTSAEVEQAGYDIKENTRWLENFYTNIAKASNNNLTI